MQSIPIEKIFSNRDSIRKAREAFLIQKDKTLDPDGLNIREETFYCFLRYVNLLFYFTNDMFIFNLHCQLVLRIPVICYIKTRPNVKFPLYLKKGWFGQPKYSTPAKINSTLSRFLPSYSSFYL